MHSSIYRHYMQPRNILLLLVGLLLVISLSGCSDNSHEPSLRIGTNIWPGYEPLYLARDLGYLDDHDFRLVEYSSASQVIRAYRNGAIDAAALTLDEVLLLKESGLEPRVVLVTDISDGADVIIAQPGITDIADLKGKRVGVENTALGAYVLTRAADLAAIELDDITIVPSELSEHAKLFTSKRVDAVVTFEPVRSQLLTKGGHIIFDSTAIPDEIVDVLVVRQDYLKKYPDKINYLLSQWYRALDSLYSNPEEAGKHSAKRLGLRPDAIMGAFDGMQFPDKERNRELLVGGKQPGLLTTANQLADIMLNTQLLTSSPDTESLFAYPHLQIHPPLAR